MSVSYRSGTADDVPGAAELFVEAVIDLCQRNGQPITSPPTAPMEVYFRHLAETGIFEVAEEDGRLVAFSSGIVRDARFFLSMFWTRPARQRQGIGRPLLARVWAEAERRGAKHHSVWSSIDYAALGTYLRTGMRPVGQILSFGGAPRRAPELDVELTPLDVATAAEIDARVRGTSREVDHSFLLREKTAAHAVRRGGRTLGYYYTGDGRVGPVGWDEDGRSVLLAAIATTQRTSEMVNLSVPGPNHVAIDVVVELGLAITGTSHFLASAPFGALDRYVPSGPALF